MGIVKASAKFVARTVNDCYTNHQRERLHQITFKQTGKDIEKAKRQGKYVDGSKIYQRNFAKNKRKIEQRHNNRDKFIGEL